MHLSNESIVFMRPGRQFSACIVNSGLPLMSVHACEPSSIALLMPMAGGVWCSHACTASTLNGMSRNLTRQLSGPVVFRPCLRSDACMWHVCVSLSACVVHAGSCRMLLLHAVRLCSEHMSRVWQHDAPDSLLTSWRSWC